MNQDYSNREIDAHFSDIKETLARIETQTTKTNGRVTSLEESRSSFRGWVAGFTISSFLIIALVTYIFNLKLDSIQAKQATSDIINR